MMPRHNLEDALEALEEVEDICDECGEERCYCVEICDSCNGSGEGMYDGSSCHACRGRGETPRVPDNDYFDEMYEDDIPF